MNHGTMTSQTLAAMLRRAAALRLPGVEVAQMGKVELLHAVREKEGWSALVSLGREVRKLDSHPVLRALVASGEPSEVIDRWIRLERFGHSRNRSELCSRTLEAEHVSSTLRHVANDGGAIASVNDLFMWGVFIGLLELADVEDIEAALIHASAEPLVIYGERADPALPLPELTHTLRLRCRAAQRSRPTERAPEPTSAARGGLVRLMEQDLLKKWSVAEAARALGLAPRSLQRALKRDQTSFSDLVHRTRIEAAQRMIAESSLQLTEVAFCVGFTDQAHFTRTFRRYCDVPPSAYRELLG